ncbi:MAG TPA: hypothetical protein VEA81_14375 [Burkholderiaceae bacterium]|nr:hypothetical protein [Burkholderiaceae bacterium]
MPDPDDGRRARAGAAVGDAIVEIVSRVPATRRTAVTDPEREMRRLARQAARRAAVVSGGLSLPPGPLGMLTLVPDLVAIWRIQSQLVADIAGLHGRSASLSREQMLYCLFRHAASQLLRDVVVRAGQRVVVHRLTSGAMRTLAARLGVQLSGQMVAKAASRWVPGVGAAAVAAYAWWDTERVARTAHELFSRDLVVDAQAVDVTDAPREAPEARPARGAARRLRGGVDAPSP